MRIKGKTKREKKGYTECLFRQGSYKASKNAFLLLTSLCVKVLLWLLISVYWYCLFLNTKLPQLSNLKTVPSKYVNENNNNKNGKPLVKQKYYWHQKTVYVPEVIYNSFKDHCHISLVTRECVNLSEFYFHEVNLLFAWISIICGALSDSVPFAQFKTREKHPRRSVNFSKVAGFTKFNTPPWVYLTFFKLYK